MTAICPYCGQSFVLGCEPVKGPTKPGSVLRGEQAYELRALGLSWPEVAREMGYKLPGSKGAAYHLAQDWAKRYGKSWPPWEPPVKVT